MFSGEIQEGSISFIGRRSGVKIRKKDDIAGRKVNPGNKRSVRGSRHETGRVLLWPKEVPTEEAYNANKRDDDDKSDEAGFGGTSGCVDRGWHGRRTKQKRTMTCDIKSHASDGAAEMKERDE